MCEKPLALTIRSCDLIISAAEQSGKILSVAENFRRDPINRLVRALLDDGAIGERQFMMETSVWGRDTIFITPWRHMKLTGAVTLDAGVHNADIMRYYFGDPASAFGQGRLFETTRRKAPGAGPGNFWEAWVKVPDVIKPTGEDAMFGTINFRNGAVAQWVFHNGGHGQPFHHRMVFGARGSIAATGDRNGRPVRLTLDVDRYRRRARARIRSELPIVPGCGRALRRGANPEIRFRFCHDGSQDHRPRAPRIRRMRADRREAGSRWRSGQARDRNGLFDVRIPDSGAAGDDREIESGAVDAYQREIDEHIGLVDRRAPQTAAS